MSNPQIRTLHRALEKLKEKKDNSADVELNSAPKPQEKGMGSQRIRKKGI
jgi:hypothetical protein